MHLIETSHFAQSHRNKTNKLALDNNSIKHKTALITKNNIFMIPKWQKVITKSLVIRVLLF